MNVDIDLVHTIGKIAFTIIILLSFFLLTVKSNIKQANRLFAVFLLLVAFDLLGLFLYGWLNAHPVIDLIRRTASLLQMPLIYFYVLAICYQDFKLNVSLLKHTFVFLFIWLIFLPRFLPLKTVAKSQFLQDSTHFELIAKSVIGEIQYFFYIVLIFMTLANYKKLYQENYASYDKTAYHWLFQMTVISLCAHLFAMTKGMMVYFADAQTVLMAHLVISLIILTVICWLVLKALYHPSITRGINSGQKLVASKSTESNNVQVSSPEIETQIEQLKIFMRSNEPYLDPEVTIESLAQLRNVPSKELSALINCHLGQNFFSFINSYRIQKAKELLINSDDKHISVLEILYQVGFNSKSSFNTAFKKHTGKTPTAYRNQAIKTA